MADGDGWRYGGFASPNTTPVPDAFFDEVMTHLKEAELRVLLYIIRRTFGFKKDGDTISYSQFLTGITTRAGKRLDEGAGIASRRALSQALQGLEAKGLIVAVKQRDARGGTDTTLYQLRFRDAAPVSEGYSPRILGAQTPVAESHPQESSEQETVSLSDQMPTAADLIAARPPSYSVLDWRDLVAHDYSRALAIVRVASRAG